MPAEKKSQKARFIEAAHAAEADESEEAFEAAFSKIVPPKKPGDKVKPKHDKGDRDA